MPVINLYKDTDTTDNMRGEIKHKYTHTKKIHDTYIPKIQNTIKIKVNTQRIYTVK